jgi:hypothetical protein
MLQGMLSRNTFKFKFDVKALDKWAHQPGTTGSYTISVSFSRLSSLCVVLSS